MATIVYLDVEDEITTVAARIRAAGEPRVGIVVPFGSRVATSRINFRLLAREAQDAGRRLDVVAPDASARALAASAGLPVFASVGEYEAALASGDEPAPPIAPAPVSSRSTGRRGPRGAAPASVASGAGIGGSAAAASGKGLEGAKAAGGRPAGGPQAQPDRPPVAASAHRSRRGPLILLAAVVVVAVGFGGVAAAVLLPTAEITLTPQMEAVTPVSLTVRADPTARAVDQAGLVVPATSLDVPVTAQGDFNATGTNVVQTAATGDVTFDSVNTVNAMPIPGGTRVSTLDGVTFVTTAGVTVPRATVSGTTIAHGFATVGIAALAPGPKGNVDARTINQVSSGLAALQVSVSNAAPTTGGTRTETPKITSDDVKAATDKLAQDVTSQVASAVADPSIVPAGATVYPATAKLGPIAYTPDPTSLDGKGLKAGQTSFTLQADATVTVLAVDQGPLQGMGEAAIRAAVKPGYLIDEGSISVTVSDGTVGEDGSVSYTIAAAALQSHPLDAKAVKASVLGKSPEDAKAALAQYGRAEVSLSPFWVTSVPSDPERVTLTIGAPAKPAATPPPSPTATPRPTPKASKAPPTPKPSAAGPSPSTSPGSPVPSG
jgi:hypothetical protein